MQKFVLPLLIVAMLVAFSPFEQLHQVPPQRAEQVEQVETACLGRALRARRGFARQNGRWYLGRFWFG